MFAMYLYLKSFHIISMVAWFAGLFYIFRLFVYHVKNKDNPQIAKVFETMERKLLYMIMHPAMFLTIFFGVEMLIKNPEILKASWFHIKLLLVLLLIGYQLFSGHVTKRFAKGDFFISQKICRLINEVPTILLIGIVLLVVLK